jgi:DNA-binding SARP family transcriptional activator/Tfp pilus assembly protein PilF
MRFAILGPLDVWDGGRRVTVGGPQQRALLAVLLLHANRVVSTGRLVDCLWGEQPPARARNLLQGCVAGLRRALRSRDDPDWRPLLTRPPGYLLQVRPGELDLDRFEELVAAALAGRPGSPGGGTVPANGLLSEALSLWRGPALADIDLAECRVASTRLEERRLEVLEQRIDLDLRLGRHAGLIAELQACVRDHPLRESLWAQLMRALFHADRQADALAAYQQLRQVLVEQLGVEPGEAVQRLHRAILSGELAEATEPAARSVPVGSVATGGPAPAQLPPAIAAFAGREKHLKQLDELLAGAASGMPIGVISGTAGIGKTTLAVQWAQRNRDWFSDGQLYLNLRGFGGAGDKAVPAAEALRGFLEALGIPPERIPTSPSEQAGRYRSLLADRRMLVLLDNAVDADQVRPLLPGSPGCLVLVTSRNQLAGLVASDGARPVPLDLLTDDEARQLLARRLGADQVMTEPDAAERIVTRCAGLPLALAVVAARAATYPNFPLAAVAGELGEERGGLDPFTGDDAATDVRAVFSWSYHALGADAARLFRLLALHPGPDIGVPAAASLAGVPVTRVRRLLADLTRANLLTEHQPGRYTLHDLLRAYAAEQARAIDSDAERDAAVNRVFDHYLHTAHRAALLLGPLRAPSSLPSSGGELFGEELADREQALAWSTTEYAVLLAAVHLAAETGFDDHAWRLAWILSAFLDLRGHRREWVAAGHAALAAAERLADQAAVARAHFSVGRAYLRSNQYGDAGPHLTRALSLFTETGDDRGRADTYLELGIMHHDQDNHREAYSLTQRSLELFRLIRHRTGEGYALNNIGWYSASLGDYRQALTACRQALELFRELGDHRGQSLTWDSIGLAHRRLGDHEQAVASYQQAIDLLPKAGNHYYLADALTHLGDTHSAAGRPERAREVWQRALTIFDDLRDPLAGEVRARLRDEAH